MLATVQSVSDEYISYSFDSPWSPPLEGITAISRLFPDLHFTLRYEEEGNGFEGEATFQDGEMMDDCQEIEYEECPECKEKCFRDDMCRDCGYSAP